MKKAVDFLRNAIFLIGIPGSMATSITFYTKNVTISFLAIALLVFLIILYSVFYIKTRTSALLYYFRLFIGKAGYTIEEKKTKMKYTDSIENVTYSVRSNIKSRVYYTTQLIDKFTIREYANEDFVSRVTFITPAALITKPWEQDGLIYYLISLKAPLCPGQSDRIKYQFPVNNPIKIVGTFVNEMPVKKLILSVVSTGNLKLSKATYKVTGSGGTDNILVQKELEIDPNNPRTVTKEVLYPLRGYKYLIEYLFDI